MANNLNFKWGLHANLPDGSAGKRTEVGTLYFTKDEGGLYLGVAETQKPKRIQGVVQYYADLTQFKTNVVPPYSADVIYYIASENALVKWTGETIGSDGNIQSGAFTVLNVTASDFAGLTEVVTGNTGAINSLRADLGTKDQNGAPAFDRIISLEAAVSALEEFVGSGSEGDSLSSRIADLETWRNDIDDWAVNYVNDTLTSHGTAIETNNGAINGLRADLGNSTNPANGTAFKRIETVENILQDVDEYIGRDDGKKGTLTSRVSTLESEVSDLQNWSVDAGIEIGDLRADLNDEIGARNNLATTVENIRKDLGTNTFGSSTAFAQIGGLVTNVGALSGRLDGHDRSIAAVTTTANSALTQANANKQTLESLTGNLNGNYYTKAEVNNFVQGLDTDISNLEAELNEKIDDEIKAANALTYKGGIDGNATWQDISGNLSHIGDTYIVTNGTFTLQNFNGANNYVVYAGDLIVATAKPNASENSDGELAVADTYWVHVKTGYDKSFEGQLTNSVADNYIKFELTSLNGNGTAGDLGKVFIRTQGNIKASADSANVPQLTLEWGTF